MKADHVLLVGFGGPSRSEEIGPFLQEVTRGTRIPEERLGEVESHYRQIGGTSPYPAAVASVANRLRESLMSKGVELPVFVGMRNWHPFLKDVLNEIKTQGKRRGIAMVLAPHRSEASFGRYLKSVEEAKKACSMDGVGYECEYVPSWHEHPDFIEAQAAQIRKVYVQETFLVFTAHSIPVEVAKKSRYEEEFRMSSALVAKALGHSGWDVAYQSRSGRPTEAWLEPGVHDLLQKLSKQGEKTVTFVPIGFVCDNAEILYDLDIEAKEEAQRLGLRYLRAPTVADHPQFIRLLTELCLAQVGAKQRQGIA